MKKFWSVDFWSDFQVMAKNCKVSWVVQDITTKNVIKGNSLIHLILDSITCQLYIQFFIKTKTSTFQIKYSYHYTIDHAPSNVYVTHSEERHGSQVKGHYGLLEPGGNVRNVHYQVNGKDGFRSIVSTRTRSSRTHIIFQLKRNQPKMPIRHLQPVAYVL